MDWRRPVCWAVTILLVAALPMMAPARAQDTGSGGTTTAARGSDEAPAPLLEQIEGAYKIPQDAAYRLFRQPHPPPAVPMAAPVPEYERAAALVIIQDGASPVLEMLRAAVDTVPVIVVVSDIVYLTNLVDNLIEEKLDHHLLSGQIRIMEVDAESIWIRDYGPIFARDTSGRMLAVDSSYISRLPWSLERERDDIFPVFLGEMLDLPTMRPPLILDGGNFAADGRGRCFTTTSAIRDNAGRRDWVEAAMKTWIGCREVHFLEPLPGPTIRHVDMFFKIVSDDLWLLGEYKKVARIRSARDYFQAEAAARMERNLKVLEEVARQGERPVRILRVPMPDVQRIDDLTNSEKVLEELAGEAEDGDEFSQQRLELLSQWSETRQDKFFIETQRENPPYLFPTYLNLTHLKGEKKEVILVPEFTGDMQGGLDPKTVHTILRQAYPSAELRGIPADHLIEGHGAIHCVTLVVPSARLN